MVILSDETASFDNASFRGALSYAVADNANVYFSVSQGFRSGGLNFATQLRMSLKNCLLMKSVQKQHYLTISCLWKPRYTTVTIRTIKRKCSLRRSQDYIEPWGSRNTRIEWSTLWTLSDYFSLGFNGNYTESEYHKNKPQLHNIRWVIP